MTKMSTTNMATMSSNSTVLFPNTGSYLPIMKEPREERELREKRFMLGEKDTIDEPEISILLGLSGFDKDAENQMKGTRFKMDEDIAVSIMMRMDSEKLKSLKRDFRLHGGELTKVEFIERMMVYMTTSSSGADETGFLRDDSYSTGLSGLIVKETASTEDSILQNLLDLFSQIDINGDGTMQWEEFTSYIIDSTRDQDQFRVDALKTYTPSTEMLDMNKYGAPIDNVQYIHELDRLIVTEKDSPVFKVYNASDTSLVANGVGHKSQVLASQYCPKLRYLATSANDLTIGLWDVESFKLRQQLPTKEECQLALQWLPERQALLSAGVTGFVHAWDIENLTCVQSIKAHDSMIMDIHAMPTVETFATGSMNAEIGLWDINTFRHLNTLKGHTKGVLSLSYSADYRFLASAGCDHEVLIWNPYVNNLISRLKGHGSSLLSVYCVPHTPEIVSMDVEGVVKVWDIRNFSCVQTFTGEDENEIKNASSFVHMAARRERPAAIIVGGHKLHVWESESMQDPHLTDDTPCVAALFNETSLTFVTVAGCNVKIWDAATGRLLRIFRNLCRTEVTAMCLDDLARKFITGDHEGNIKVYTFSNGGFIKDLKSHTKEVVALQYVPSSKSVISIGWDGLVQVHDEGAPQGLVVIRAMNHLDAMNAFDVDSDKFGKRISMEATARSDGSAGVHDLSALAFDDNEMMFATAAVDGSICVWQFEHGTPDGACIGHNSAVTALVFLNPYPLLVSADNKGNLIIWQTQPRIHNKKVALRWRNKQNKFSDKSPAVLHMRWDPDSFTLYTADDIGIVKKWNLKGAMKKLKIHKAVRRQGLREELLLNPLGLARADDPLVSPRMGTSLGFGASVSVPQTTFLTAAPETYLSPVPAQVGAKSHGVAAGVHHTLTDVTEEVHEALREVEAAMVDEGTTVEAESPLKAFLRRSSVGATAKNLTETPVIRHRSSIVGRNRKRAARRRSSALSTAAKVKSPQASEHFKSEDVGDMSEKWSRKLGVESPGGPRRGSMVATVKTTVHELETPSASPEAKARPLSSTSTILTTAKLSPKPSINRTRPSLSIEKSASLEASDSRRAKTPPSEGTLSGDVADSANSADEADGKAATLTRKLSALISGGRRASVDIGEVHEAVAATGVEASLPEEQSGIICVAAWSAHVGSIESMTFLPEPKCVITMGQDNYVHIWSGVDGKRMGTLHQGSAQGRFCDKGWNFPVKGALQSRRATVGVAQIKQAIEDNRVRGPRLSDAGISEDDRESRASTPSSSLDANEMRHVSARPSRTYSKATKAQNIVPRPPMKPRPLGSMTDTFNSAAKQGRGKVRDPLIVDRPRKHPLARPIALASARLGHAIQAVDGLLSPRGEGFIALAGLGTDVDLGR